MATEILGVGHFLPPMIEHFGALRPIAVEAVGPSTLAARAAEPMLERVGVAGSDIDFIIFATATPDVAFPGAAVYLQQQLDSGTVGSLDIRAQCAGFLYGLTIADRFLQAGSYERILVAGAEVHSSGLDASPAAADTSRLFGDGAGVMLLRAGKKRSVLAVDLHADGREYRRFWCESPASRQYPTRVTLENVAAGEHFPQIDAEAVRAFGVDALADSMRQVLASSEVAADAIDLFIVSHIFPDVAEAALSRLGVDVDRQVIPARRYGHIMGAALPLALSEEMAAGHVAAGARVCLAAAGSGYAWGAAVLQL